MANTYFNGLVLIKPQYDNSDDVGTAENVTWWKGGFSTGLTTAQANAIQTVFDDGWSTMWAALGYTGAAYQGSILVDWSSDTGIENNTTSTFATTYGTQGGAEAPYQVAALISLSTVLRFKGGHGRVYLPALGTDALLSPALIDSTPLANAQTFYTELVSGMGAISGANGGPFVQQLFRYRDGKNSHGDPATPSLQPVNGHTAQAHLATQRRRQRKVAHR